MLLIPASFCGITSNCLKQDVEQDLQDSQDFQDYSPGLKNAPLLTVARGPVPRDPPLHRSAGACPPRTPAPGPVGQDRLILTRSGSGDPELQRWARYLQVGETSRSRCNTLEKRHPRATKKNRPLHRKARACPSPCRTQTNARGGQAPALRKNAPLHRRARACPSPCRTDEYARGPPPFQKK